MVDEKLQALTDAGQSMWLDYIDCRELQSVEIRALVEAGMRGLTSNPSFFEKAITGSEAYDDQIRQCIADEYNATEIYEHIAVADIHEAAALLRPLYDETNGGDGFVSLEVSPLLAHDTEATAEEARRLWIAVDRPNLMVKIPATPEGLSAITESIARGINVNVTLIFSRDMYARVMDAYLTGLERRVEVGEPIDHIASVASFFISRVDVMVDNILDERIEAGESALAELKGKAGIANAKLAYQLFKDTFSGERWEKLEQAGANLQRPLWASTSTKNPDYSDVLYVESLIGPHTVNTAPPDTIEAFRDHGTVELTLEQYVDEARATLDALEEAGISMEQVTGDLLEEGVAKFEKPFNSLIDAIVEKRDALVAS
ncbi:MAG: transaldolase [Anaerolineae bacterium]